MTNGLITADKIWNIIPMTKGNVDKLNAIVSETNIPDKDVVLEIIGKWKKADFTDIVQQHNYFWYSLNGTVGRATGRNEVEIEKAVRSMVR